MRTNRYRVWMIVAVLSGMVLQLAGCAQMPGSRQGQKAVMQEQTDGTADLQDKNVAAGKEEMSQNSHDGDRAKQRGKETDDAGSLKKNGQDETNVFEENCEVILNECTGEFIGYHLIDETFLSWVAKEYGKACIKKLAEEVQKEEQDTGLWYELTGNSIHVLWLLYCKKTGFQQYQLEHVTWQDCKDSTQTVLEFTGDINFAEGEATTRHLDQSPGGIRDCFSEDLLQEMNQADVMMINNEFTYSTRGQALKGKAYTFRADPSRVELLKAFGTDIVNLANNHVYDFGPDALLDTIDTLDQAGIPHVGAGADLNEAEEPWYFVCNGKKIAIVAATQIERSTNYTKEATENTPGVLKTLQPDKFTGVIREAERNSDYVIAFVHWGTEGDSNFGRDQQNLAEAIAGAGADAIIGGHTHCLQGFDWIGDVPVIYSLGNFWFSDRTQDTGLAKVTIDADGTLQLGFVPCIQKNLCTSLVTEPKEKQRIFTFLQKYSASGVTVSEDGIVEKQ